MGFEKVNSKVVKATLAGRPVIARRGAMLAYTGDVRFSPLTAGQGGGGRGVGGAMGGVMGMAGRAMAGESTALMVAEGVGEVFYGHAGLHVSVVELDGQESLTAEADRILARDESVSSSVSFLGSSGIRGAVRGAATGQGLFTSVLSGRGSVALLSHGGILELAVDGTLGVDPQAYVGHRGRLDVEVTTLGAGGLFRDAVGHGSGESVQLRVTGTGSVYIQASEQKF